jgi:hypothetical protein
MDVDYRLISHWRVPGALEDVAALLREPRDLVRWWPEVYLAVEVAHEDRGDVVHVRSRGFLPFTLSWSFRELESRWPYGATIEAWGDLVGCGVWTLVQDGTDVLATYDWRVRAEEPWLRRLSPVLKPLFAWNHRWAMAKGEAGLRREMEGRNARPGVGPLRSGAARSRPG